jgi:EmrB/QacA subfamily drug resistance transporter
MSATVLPAATRTGSPPTRRWLVLGILCLSVLVITLDGTIVNVALPSLVTELGATTSQLQWIVDAYTLVFAGLLLAAGSLGDRFGRKGALLGGMAWFGAFSLLGAMAGSADQLIAARALMGVGAALIFPATLAILVNVFTAPRERATAIAIWAATAGISVALGPVTGGWLLEHLWWGSVFVVNVPIVLVSLVLIGRYVPTSRDAHVQRFDPAGMALSAVGVTLLVWAVIEGPNHGWLSPVSVCAFALAATLLTAFVAVERASDHPMLDVGVFSNARFTAASLAVMFAFFALFGFIFMVTQYFQFVRGYGTLAAGVRTVPFALFTGVAAPLSERFAARWGAKVVIAAGLASMAVGFVVAGSVAVDAPYWQLVVAMLFMGGGLGLVNAPATESIMGSLPVDKAGVGSAVNDTTRELGGTLGVAVVGSLFSSVYGGRLADLLDGTPIPPDARQAAEDSVGVAVEVAHRAGQQAGPSAQAAVKGAIDTAFMDGFRAGSWIAAAVVLVGAVLALRFLPARATGVAAVADEPFELARASSTLHPDATVCSP